MDEYVFHCLREMQHHVSEIAFVSNGKLEPLSRESVLEMGIQIIERPNEGFDTWAYRQTLREYGWPRLTNYDEIILMNSTIVGPIDSFDAMFATMSAKDLDFWGITVHYGDAYDPWGKIELGFIPKHLQSYFLAIRKHMVGSEAFQNYWADMPTVTSYEEAVSYHEVIFTRHFEEQGFAWEAYVQTDDLEPLTSYPLMFLPQVMLEEKRCPIFKRKSFLLTMEEMGGANYGDLNRQLQDALKRLHFDTQPLIRHLIRSADQTTLRNALGAYYLVPGTQLSDHSNADAPRYLVRARIEDSYTAALFASYLPDVYQYADVHIVTASKEIQQYFMEGENASLSVYLCESSSTFLPDLEDIPAEYPWVCYLGFADPFVDTSRRLPHLEYFRFMLDSLLGSKEQVLNYVASDTIPSHYGLLMPVSAVHHAYKQTAIDVWQKDYAQVKALLQATGVQVAIPEFANPYAPIGASFWIRRDILEQLKKTQLLKAGQSCHSDRVILQALPFLLQRFGTLCAQVSSVEVAQYYLNMLASEVFSQPQLEAQKKYTSAFKCEFYLDTGTGYNAEEVLIRTVSAPDASLSVQCCTPAQVKSIRFDPDIGYSLICRNARAFHNGRSVVLIPLNGIRNEDVDIFLTNDPQYHIEGPFAEGDTLSIQLESVQRLDRYDFLPINEYRTTYAEPLNDTLKELNDRYVRLSPAIQSRIVQKALHFLSRVMRYLRR
ncbi:MAG: rhamnan synthesis F family protein [Coriobacteriales bacterium]|nr:rhamnan synthesis F family protein [Coriobacteriales bacterium]